MTVQCRQLEVRRLAGADARKPVIVFLHEGLGSASMWRDFPRSVVRRTGCPAVIYSRYGYGNSDLLDGERQVDYMHREALESLPELLEKLAVRNPILLGHSDGASIALIYAGALNDTRALILLAPHVFVEDLTIDSIDAAKMAFKTTNLAEKLAPYHRDPASTFWGWNRIWLDSTFRSWNIEQFLPHIKCPVLAMQGLDDQYGTLAQLDSIERQVPARVERVHLENCRHSPHRDHPTRVIEAIGSFIDRLLAQ